MRSKSWYSKREDTSSVIQKFRISYTEISNALLFPCMLKKITNVKIFNRFNILFFEEISVDKR